MNSKGFQSYVFLTYRLLLEKENIFYSHTFFKRAGIFQKFRFNLYILQTFFDHTYIYIHIDIYSLPFIYLNYNFHELIPILLTLRGKIGMDNGMFIFFILDKQLVHRRICARIQYQPVILWRGLFPFCMLVWLHAIP